MDKLIYRLSNEKDQLNYIDYNKDSFKFIGYGYGCHLLMSYLGYYYAFFPILSGVMLVNPFSTMPSNYLNMLKSLLQLYESEDLTANEEAYLFYNKGIDSS